MKHYQQYIDGAWTDSSSGATIDVINPATEDVIATVPKATREDVDRAVASAKRAFPEWNARSVKERAAYVEKILAGVEKNQERLAQIITAELGAPITFSRKAHLPQVLVETRTTLDELSRFPFEETLDDTLLIKEGIGVVACITPWNYPLNQIQRKLTPALLAGCTVIVKPASATPLTAVLYAQIIEEAGLPKGVFQLVTGSGSEAGNVLAGHPDVALISFTGSTEVGRGLYNQAAPTIKKLILELGGKSPLIYLKGGDLQRAVRQACNIVFDNQGQTCSALTRLIVPESEKNAVEEALLDYYKKKVHIGNPADPATTIGPMVSREQKERVLSYIELGKREGARLLIGGNDVDRKGYYVEPTVFVDVTNDMRIAREEIFGPVLCVLSYKTVEEAIAIANDSPFGLSGAVVGPAEDAKAVARRLRTGNVTVNFGKRNYRAPFGGYKESGLGRENGLYGLNDYLEIKALFL